MAIQQMRITCWIPKATNAHSRSVTLIAFPLQQVLQEKLNVTLYVHCSLYGSYYHFLPEKSVEFIAVCSQHFIWIVLNSSLYLSRPVFLKRAIVLKKRIYRAAVSQRMRNSDLDNSCFFSDAFVKLNNRLIQTCLFSILCLYRIPFYFCESQ